MRTRRNESGAALLIALAIFVILLTMGLAFFLLVQSDTNIAKNVNNQPRAEQQADGVTNMAKAFLNASLTRRPGTTSLDDAWRAYFNGTWAAGKSWAVGGGVPEVDITLMPIIRFDDNNDGFFNEADYSEVLYNGPRTRHWLYIPRAEGNFKAVYLDTTALLVDLAHLGGPSLPITPPISSPGEKASLAAEGYQVFAIQDPDSYDPLLTNMPFVITDHFSPNRGYPLEQIAAIADVDNDGDGLPDSAWIPLPADQFFDHDGIDNDLDNVVDEPGELALYYYNGRGNFILNSDGTPTADRAGDGLDNDRDGQIDENDPSEASQLFLTTPIFGVPIPVTWYDGVNRSDQVVLSNGETVRLMVYVNSLDVNNDGTPDHGFLQDPSIVILDGIDSDFDQKIDDYVASAYVGAFQGDSEDWRVESQLPVGRANVEYNFERLGLTVVDPPPSVLDFSIADVRVFHSGEPVCELMGRAAVLVNDEASRVNLNMAGGFNINFNTLVDDRIFNEGATPFEYETRMLPGIDEARARALWYGRMGDMYAQGDPTRSGGPDPINEDVLSPGYGRVDDNGNALLLMLNNRDDDGDGLFDFNDLWEGIDEAAEFQRLHTYRHRIAEMDGLDLDGDGIIDEVGELGDFQLGTVGDIMQLTGFSTGLYERLRNVATVHSTDRATGVLETTSGIRALNRLNYNYANAPQIAAHLILHNEMSPVTTAPVTIDPVTFPIAEDFALGLRQGDRYVTSPTGMMWFDTNADALPDTATLFNLAADPQLEALQMAVDLVDNRDADYGRATLSTNILQPFSDSPFAWPLQSDLNSRELPDPTEVLQLDELWRHIRDLKLTMPSALNVDYWWETLTDDTVGTPGVIDGERRTITHTATGTEAIRINEIMVRPVRRVEAEATPDNVNFPFTYTLNTDPSPLPRTDLAGAVSNVLFAPDGLGVFQPSSILPDFFMSQGNLLGTLGWLPNGSGLLGDSTVWATADGDSILEYVFLASEGLPTGRYYLSANITDPLGNPIGINSVQYAIKYIQVRLDVNGLITPIDNTITQDIVAAGIGGDAWIDTFFTPVDGTRAQHIAGLRPGMQPNMVFFDGNPEAVVSGIPKNPADPLLPDNLYYEDAIGEFGVNGFLDPAVFGDPLIYGALADYRINRVELSHTVLIPPPINPNPAGNVGYALCVAIKPQHDLVGGNRAIPNNGVGIALNYLEFSQEPDHEYVEVVNVSNKDVDIARWVLEVGIPDRINAQTDPMQLRLQVPDNANTVIPPGGMALLAVNPFDTFNAPTPAVFQVQSNGIGLARGDDIAPGNVATWAMPTVTVPPMANHPNHHPSLVERGSVFDRPFFVNDPINYTTDFVDVNGDSLKDAGTANTPAWSRIIDVNALPPKSNLASPLVSMENISSVNDLALLVLRGGIFPNLPERDNIDNDGDGGYLAADLARPTYIPGTLEKDMVDNDLDGLIDERGRGWIDIAPLNGVYDPGTGEDPNLLSSEGVDEGNFLWANSSAGMYSDATIPRVIFTSPAGYPGNAGFDQLINTGIPPFPYVSGTDLNGDAVLDEVYINSLLALGGPVTEFGDPSNPFLPGPSVVNDGFYMGSAADPVQWKAFVERRWYPGDNVIVSLYTGDPDGGAGLADRVTYREYDITNRTVDDMVDSPYLIGGIPVSLNANDWSLWPEDHMALDFYRALERKHPFYNGDKFGTTNRWEATDGNYDDWADSPSFFEGVMIKDPGAPINDGTMASINSRFFGANALNNERLIAHGMYGSPLRANWTARILDNRQDQARILASTDPLYIPPYTLEPAYVGLNSATDVDLRLVNAGETLFPALNRTYGYPNFYWGTTKLDHSDVSFSNPGQLLGLPHLMFEEILDNSVDSLEDIVPVNLQYLYFDTLLASAVPLQQSLSLRGVLLGQDQTDFNRKNAFDAVCNSGSFDAIVLTAGQAEFKPILPTAADIVADPNIMHWESLDAGSAGAPATWAPFSLFAFPGETMVDYRPIYTNGDLAPLQYEGLFLFDGTALMADAVFSGGLPQAELERRWRPGGLTQLEYQSGTDGLLAPQEMGARWFENRVVMYITQSNSPTTGAEALFVWDAEDGLENGDYVVYIGTSLPNLTEAANAINAANPGLVDANGLKMLNDLDPNTAGQPMDAALGIEIITDPSQAQGGQGGAAGLPAAGTPGMVYRPGADGYIFYGNQAAGGWRARIVHVRDNFLALRVRNWGSAAQTACISHVVLAPRKRTPGKINVNTTLTRAMDDVLTQRRLFEPLMPLPGILDAHADLGLAFDFNMNPLPNIGTYPPMAPHSLAPLAADIGLNTPWPAPYDFVISEGASVPVLTAQQALNPLLPDRDEPIVNDAPDNAYRVASARLSGMLTVGRTEHWDGRYYENLAQLAQDDSMYSYDRALGLKGYVGLFNPSGASTGSIYPLSNEDNPSRRFDEVYRRFNALSNNITVNSDVFEIIVTVQTGFGVDQNADGRYNYRDDNEFEVLAETKRRTVYERRAPSDLSDQVILP